MNFNVINAQIELMQKTIKTLTTVGEKLTNVVTNHEDRIEALEKRLEES